MHGGSITVSPRPDFDVVGMGVNITGVGSTARLRGGTISNHSFGVFTEIAGSRFYMYGGEIIDNKEGVSIAGGFFRMNGGLIEGNFVRIPLPTAVHASLPIYLRPTFQSIQGGGVNLANTVFAMHGGRIVNN